MPTKDPVKKQQQRLRWLEKHPGRMYEMQKKWRESNRDRANQLSRESRRRNLAVMAADPADKRHGTLTGYVYGCRCAKCMETPKRSDRKHTSRALNIDDPRHGTNNGYKNYRCRCELCTAANSAHMAAYRAARKHLSGEVDGA